MSNNPRDSTFKGKGNSHSPSLPDQSGEASGSNNPNPNPNFNPSASTLDSTCRPPPSTNRNLPDNRRQFLPSANRYIPPGSVASGQRNGFAGSSSSAAAAASGIGSNRAGREDREMTEAERQRERERKHQREQDRLSENERSREREAEKQRQRERSNASNSFSMRPSGSNLNLDVNSFQDSKPIPQVRPSNNAPSAVRKAVEISKGSEGGITSINQRPSQFTSDRITDDVLSKDVDRSLEIRENGAERMGMDIDLDSGLDFIDPSRLVGGNMMMENQDLDGSRMVDHRQGREGFAGGGTHSFQPLASSSIFQPQQALNSVPMQNSNSNNSSKNLTFNQNGNAVPQEDTSSRFMTGLVYSTEMMKHSNSNEEDHPEAPERIFKIFNTINQAGLVKRMKRIKIRECVKQEVELIHHTQVWAGAEASACEFFDVERVSNTLIKEQHVANLPSSSLPFRTSFSSVFSREQLNLHWETTDRYRSLYLNEHTAQCARLSCGGVIEMCDAVASRKVRNGFAIVRPPGHHAEPDASMGFCFYNNVAVAAAWLLKRYSLEELSPSILSSSSDSSTPTKNSIPRPRNLIEKILIVDWDVHHGNGTQKAFYSNPNVLYISIHRYENGTFYPGTTLGGANMIGESEGEGFNINIPWPCSNMGDGEYLKAFYEVIMPVTMEFNPDFVIISAGFDAARGDQLGECDITPQGFAHLTQMLASLADGRCVAALEVSSRLVETFAGVASLASEEI